MAVIIDGWDKLPGNCYDCDLHNYHVCDLTGNSIEDYCNGETREPSCPLKEVPTGHWIFDKERLGYWISTCSECGHTFHGNEVLIYKPKFCANCGAKMEEGL